MAETIIFYSWQSDHRSTKDFIDKALNSAIKELAGDNTLDKATRLDKDTQGTVGSPSIVATIKQKIDNCGVFVADVSIVDESKNARKLVNQNVMFELGYAIAKHSEMNVMMLFNSDLGDPKDLPFDISHHRILPFSLEKDDKNGTKLKAKLIGALTAHLNSLDEQEVVQIEQNLDEIELLIMRIFASMGGDKRIIASKSMTSWHVRGSMREDLYDAIGKIDAQEFIATLDELMKNGILTKFYGSNGTPSYKPAKQGFEIIKVLNSKTENKLQPTIL